MNSDKNKYLIFDGECIMCNSIVYFLFKRISHLNYKFIPSASMEGKNLILKHSLDNITNDTVVLISEDKRYFRFDAFFVIINDMNSFWKFLNVLKILPKPILTFIYNIIAKNRKRIFAHKIDRNYCKHEI